jgi:hypothetical protein
MAALNLTGSPSPHSFKFAVTKEEGTSVFVEFPPPSFKTQPISVKSEIPPPYTLSFPKLPVIQTASLLVKSPPTPIIQNPPFPNQMAVVNPPENIMDAIVVAWYAPLMLPQPMNALPIGDYLKYMPKFTGEEDITAEEHLATFYSYADNLKIENEDVWMTCYRTVCSLGQRLKDRDQTGVTGTFPTQCHLNGEVLSV